MAEEDQEFEPLSIEFPDLRKRTFKSVEQIQKWAQTEYETWQAFHEATNGSRPFRVDNPVLRSLNVSQAIQNHAAEYFSEGDRDRKQNILNNVISHVETYASDSACIDTKSQLGKLLIALAEEDPEAATVLFASGIELVIDAGHINDMRRYVEAAYRAERAYEEPENHAKAHKSLLADTRADWEGLIKSSTEEFDAKVEEFEAARRDADKSLGRLEEHHKRLFKLFRRQHDNTHKSISDLADTYHKKLQLEAPATYWARRRNIHMLTAFLAAALFLLGIILALKFGLEHGVELLGMLPKSNDGTIGLGGIAVLTIPAAGVAWGLRIFTRLFTHQLEMATDAAQRQTMITTYLALNNDPAAQLGDDERILILNAIFRPSEIKGSGDAPPPNLMDLAKSVSGKSN